MAQPYLGEMRIFSFDFPPRFWALCDGQLLQISKYQALYSILGTAYGGDGHTTFGLPDLCGRVPVHRGSTIAPGEKRGEEAHKLTDDEVPSHIHGVFGATVPATTTDASGNFPALTSGGRRPLTPYASLEFPVVKKHLTPLLPGSIEATGALPHENMQPYLALNICIAIQGLFPPGRRRRRSERPWG